MTDLRSLAMGATPGPWRIGRLGTEKAEHVVDMGEPPEAPFAVMLPGHPSTGSMRGWPASAVVHSDDDSSAANAAFIAAANPQAILTLLDRIAGLKEALRPFAKIADAIAYAADKPDDVAIYGHNLTFVTYGDFRRARAALGEHHE